MGAVAAQITNAQIRLIQTERQIKEQDEVIARLDGLEEAASRDKKGGRRWHA